MTKDLEFARAATAVAQQLDRSRRATGYADGQAESTAAHSIHLGLLALQFAHLDGVSVPEAVVWAVLHDLADAGTPDVNTAFGLSPEQREAKKRREQIALQRITHDLFGMIRSGTISEDHTEHRLAARFGVTDRTRAWVWCMDKVAPKLLHLDDGGAALRRMGMTHAQMVVAHDAQRVDVARVAETHEFELALALFDAAIARCAQELRDLG